MFNINQILEQAVEKEASDVHLILESKPMCRVGNVLVKMEGAPVLKEKDILLSKDLFSYESLTKMNPYMSSSNEYKKLRKL